MLYSYRWLWISVKICTEFRVLNTWQRERDFFPLMQGEEAKLEGFYCRVWLAFLFTVNLRKAFSGKETG